MKFQGSLQKTSCYRYNDELTFYLTILSDQEKEMKCVIFFRQSVETELWIEDKEDCVLAQTNNTSYMTLGNFLNLVGENKEWEILDEPELDLYQVTFREPEVLSDQP